MTFMPPLPDYAAAEAWLLSITDYERLMGNTPLRYDTRTFDLDHFRQQLIELGSPHLKYPVIHVAGTKGKGSTCAFLESALRQNGFKTGLYTSPHLTKFTERIRINGAEIAEDDFCRLLERTGSHVIASASNSDNRSFRTVFEILTASAFLHFAEQGVDVAVIETGLGGRLDSTNVFSEPGAGPLINVITAIGLDHTAILGDTLEAIAGEKAGIIKPHSNVVVAAQISPATEAVVHDVVSRRCTELGSAEPVWVHSTVSMTSAVIASATSDCWRYTLKPTDDSGLALELQDGIDICPALEGEHQARNVATALATLAVLDRELRIAGITHPIAADKVKEGLERAVWPGRFHVVDGDVPVVIDGAHCALSAAALGAACQSRFGAQPAVLVTGFLKDKAGKDLLQEVVQHIPVVHAVALAAPTPRSLSVDEIAVQLEGLLGADKVSRADSLEEAMATAQAEAGRTGGYIVLFGSLYHVGPALELFCRN